MNRIVSGTGLLLVATVLGVITAAAAFGWLSQAEKSGELVADASEETIPVVVANAEIAAGTRLTSELVTVREVPESMLLVGAAGEIDTVIGRSVRYPLTAGEQVTDGKLVLEGEVTGNGLAFSVPPGMRAVSVPVDEVLGAGGLVVPGDRVDVLVHTDYERLFGPLEIAASVEDEEQDQPTVITVLQDVMVLAVGQETTPPIDAQRDAATLRPEDAEAQPSAESVTLAVTSGQAQSLFLATQEGTIGLALRSFGDTHTSLLEPAVRLEPLGPANASLASNP